MRFLAFRKPFSCLSNSLEELNRDSSLRYACRRQVRMTDGTTHPSEFRVTLLPDFGRPGTRAVRPLGKPFRKDAQAEQANGAAKSTGYCPAGLRNPLTPQLWESPCLSWAPAASRERSEEHTSELQSRLHLVCRLLLEKKN